MYKPQLEKLETVEKMFNFMKQELDSGSIVKAEYNKESGYPEKIGITYSSMVDAIGYFYIEKFEIVK